MYIFVMEFWYFDTIQKIKIIRRYSIVFDFEDYQIDLEHWRNHFIDDLQKEMKEKKAKSFYIHKSRIYKEH